MRAYVPLLFSFAALLGFAPHASAQAVGKYAVTLLTIDGKTPTRTNDPRINKKQCSDKVQVHFRITGLPGTNSNPMFIELWSGQACNTSARKSETSGTACELIEPAKMPKPSVTQFDYIITADVLCKTEGLRNLWFLGVTTENDSLDVGTDFGFFGKLTIDQNAPSAPTKLNAGSGESAIKISWRAPTEEVDHFVLVWDPAATSGSAGAAGTGSSSADEEDGGAATAATPAECSATSLEGGAAIDLDGLEQMGIGVKKLTGQVESTTVSDKTIGSNLAAIGVVAVDRAGNVSPLSNLDCLHVVPTTGFWDTYQKNGGKVEEGCACSLPGRAVNVANAWPLALVLFGLAMRARRRRS